jgi:hypothetical protein
MSRNYEGSLDRLDGWLGGNSICACRVADAISLEGARFAGLSFGWTGIARCILRLFDSV